jgi:hypothetical protein
MSVDPELWLEVQDHIVHFTQKEPVARVVSELLMYAEISGHVVSDYHVCVPQFLEEYLRQIIPVINPALEFLDVREVTHHLLIEYTHWIFLEPE